MFETESSISPRNDLPAEVYGAIDWCMPDDLDLIGPDYVCLDECELLSYAVGAAVAAAVIPQGRLAPEYPPSLLAAFTDGITKADAVATFSVICLASFALNLFASASGLRRATIWDGLLSSYAALGIYLFPQVTIHWPFLVAIVVAGIALNASVLSQPHGPPEHLAAPLACISLEPARTQGRYASSQETSNRRSSLRSRYRTRTPHK